MKNDKGVNEIIDLENSFSETDMQNSDEKDNSICIKQLAEQLFSIKESLLVGEEMKIHKNSEIYLSQINVMLEDYPVLCEKLYKWKFLTNEVLYLLRSKYFDTTLLIVTKIIDQIKVLPSEYIKSKFIHFIMEKLYNKLKLSAASTGISILKRNIGEDINIETNDNVNDDNYNDNDDNMNDKISSLKKTNKIIKKKSKE